MVNQIENLKQDKKKNRKKIILAICLLLLALLMGIGLVVAYFSDMIEQSSDLSAGTLNISGDYEYYVNSVLKTTGNVSNLNPGDIIVIRANVTNEGNKSAWIRNAINFTTADNAILPYLEIYEGQFSKDDLATDLSGYLLPLVSGTAVSDNYVINGTGADAETETGGGYNYLGSNTYQFAITIYFNSSATNEVQGKAFNLTIKTQALQFRNNNTTEPSDAAWATVSAISST